MVVTDLATRYGTPSSDRRRLRLVAAAGLGLVLVAWLVWAWLPTSSPAVRSGLEAYGVVDDHTATATFSVERRTSDVEASCLLRAQAADHSVVGELNVAVGPGGQERSRLTETIRTDRRATTVHVVGCLAEGQSRRQ